jgi:hypothetical protein
LKEEFNIFRVKQPKKSLPNDALWYFLEGEEEQVQQLLQPIGQN